MTDEQFDKLPQYARWEIERLRANLKFAEETIAEVTGEVPASKITPQMFDVLGDKQTPLPCDTIRWPHFGIEVRADSNGLTVRAIGNRMPMLVVMPRDSSSACVAAVEYDANIQRSWK